jgi:hypothetical protein
MPTSHASPCARGRRAPRRRGSRPAGVGTSHARAVREPRYPRRPLDPDRPRQRLRAARHRAARRLLLPAQHAVRRGAARARLHSRVAGCAGRRDPSRRLAHPHAARGRRRRAGSRRMPRSGWSAAARAETRWRSRRPATTCSPRRAGTSSAMACSVHAVLGPLDGGLDPLPSARGHRVPARGEPRAPRAARRTAPALHRRPATSTTGAPRESAIPFWHTTGAWVELGSRSHQAPAVSETARARGRPGSGRSPPP